jgi:hypothetical protein
MAKMSSRLLGLACCAAVAMASAADFPPLADTTPTGERFPGKFIWADLFTGDPVAAQTFYTGLFGWEATTIERSTSSGVHAYIVMRNAGDPVAGIAHRPARLPDTNRGRWIGYISVPDVAKALQAGTAAGSQVLFPAKDLPKRGTQAMLIDPEGAQIGLLHSAAGDPGEYARDSGDFIWAQLFARDPAAEGKFYTTLAGLDPLPDTRNDRPNSFVLVSGDYSRASVVPLPPRPNAKPAWVLFVRVPDVKAATAKATSLGGRVLVAPSDEPTEYWRAIVADPTGGVIGLVQLLDEEKPKVQP